MNNNHQPHGYRQPVCTEQNQQQALDTPLELFQQLGLMISGRLLSTARSPSRLFQLSARSVTSPRSWPSSL